MKHKSLIIRIAFLFSSFYEDYNKEPLSMPYFKVLKALNEINDLAEDIAVVLTLDLSRAKNMEVSILKVIYFARFHLVNSLN